MSDANEVVSKLFAVASTFKPNPDYKGGGEPWDAEEGTARRGKFRPTGLTLLDTIVAAVAPDIRYGGNEAGTTWEEETGKSYIALPKPEAFKPGAYAKTLAHELVHWTQPQTGRDPGRMSYFDQLFGIVPPGYAQEEVVAELGASLLLDKAGADVDFKAAGEYVGGWLASIRSDDEREAAIRNATEQAQRAVDWLESQVAP